MKTLVLVLGMHRSGTSAATGTLGILGANLGNSLLQAADDNPKGFFEDVEFNNLNIQILKDYGGEWNNPPYIDFKGADAKGFKIKIKEILSKKLSNTNLFALKDPRISILFPLYEEAAKELNLRLKIIVCLRDYKEIAESLKKRNNMPEEVSIKLSMFYLQRIKDFVGKNRDKITIRYDDLLLNTEEVIHGICAYLPELSTNELKMKEVNDFLSSSLKHNHSSYNKQPAFFILGAQKSATTTLYNLLKNHHDISMPPEKELHFFSSSRFVTQGYASYENRIDANKTWGEATPYYLFHPLVPKRIKRYSPNSKFIICLRDPLARATSQYHHNIRIKTETLSLKDAFEQQQVRTLGARESVIADEFWDSHELQNYAYYERGYYSEQISRWFKLFDRNQFLFLKFDEIVNEPQDTINKITQFLELSPLQLPTEAIKNYYPGNYEKNNLITRIRSFFLFWEEKRKLKKLIGTTW